MPEGALHRTQLDDEVIIGTETALGRSGFRIVSLMGNPSITGIRMSIRMAQQYPVGTEANAIWPLTAASILIPYQKAKKPAS